jgi:hypothetical protein
MKIVICDGCNLEIPHRSFGKKYFLKLTTMKRKFPPEPCFMPDEEYPLSIEEPRHFCDLECLKDWNPDEKNQLLQNDR